jgi:5-formyltetrahydrofolate cyclo-ligase
MMSKAKLRIAVRERRKELARDCPDFAARIANYASDLLIPPHAKVASFMALPDEADPELLSEALAKEGCEICFPRVHQKAQPLLFHVPVPGEHMARGAFGILEPPPHWPVAVPDVLLVPLLAFDSEGYRLGYGGGLY